GAGFLGRTGAAVRSTRPSARRRRRFGAAQESTRPPSVRSFELGVSVTASLCLTAPGPGAPPGAPGSVEVIHHPDAPVGQQRGRAGVHPERLVVALVAREGVGVDGALALRPEPQRIARPVDPFRLRVPVAAAVAARVAFDARELADEESLAAVDGAGVRRLEDLPEGRPAMLLTV